MLFFWGWPIDIPVTTGFEGSAALIPTFVFDVGRVLSVRNFNFNCNVEIQRLRSRAAHRVHVRPSGSLRR